MVPGESKALADPLGRSPNDIRERPIVLEEVDILGAYGHHGLTATRAVAERVGDVRSDLEIYQALAERLGFGAKMAGSAEEWCERVLVGVGEGINLAALQQGAVRNPQAAPILFAGRRFQTEDERFHFVTGLDLQAPDDAGEYPLTLGSFSTSSAQSSQWSRPLPELLPARCHPQAAPWASEGQIIQLESPVGRLRATISFDESLHPNLVLVPKGCWLCEGKAANVLVAAQTTDEGLGANYYDAPVRLVPIAAGAQTTTAP